MSNQAKIKGRQGLRKKNEYQLNILKGTHTEARIK